MDRHSPEMAAELWCCWLLSSHSLPLATAPCRDLAQLHLSLHQLHFCPLTWFLQLLLPLPLSPPPFPLEDPDFSVRHLKWQQTPPPCPPHPPNTPFQPRAGAPAESLEGPGSRSLGQGAESVFPWVWTFSLAALSTRSQAKQGLGAAIHPSVGAGYEALHVTREGWAQQHGLVGRALAREGVWILASRGNYCFAVGTKLKHSLDSLPGQGSSLLAWPTPSST